MKSGTPHYFEDGITTTFETCESQNLTLHPDVFAVTEHVRTFDFSFLFLYGATIKAILKLHHTLTFAA